MNVRLIDSSGECALCGQWRPRLNRDHIVPRYRGGTDEPSNIQYLCANCHEDKSDGERRAWRPTDEQRAKMRLVNLGNKRALGRRASPETRAKMSAARRGVAKSPAARVSISLAAQRRERTKRGRFAA